MVVFQHVSIWLLSLLVGRAPFVANHQINMNSNASDAFPRLQPLILWTVHSERPDDASLSCYMVNTSWFCTDDSVLQSFVDNDDSY